MKVLIAIVFAIGSVSALGSGPYLPSGWKPDGPSFYLPSETTKPADSPLKENLLLETEASGSDALREYGPPKLEVVQVVANQGLPDVATEQTFFVEAKISQDVVSAVEKGDEVEASTEQISAITAEIATATEAQLGQISIEEQTTDVLSELQPTEEARALDVLAEIVEQTSEVVQGTAVDAQEEVVTPTVVIAQEEIVVPTAGAQEEIVVSTGVIQEDLVSNAGAQEETVVSTDIIQEEAVLPTAVVQEEIAVPTPVVEKLVVEELAVGVNNIAEALVNLEKEIKAAEAYEGVVEIKQELTGSSQQVPEGFLEYGPPGFREYGPPKQEEIVRSAAVELAPTNAFENNEVRRRRFSPKFRSSKKH